MESFRETLWHTAGEADWRFIMHFEDGLGMLPADLLGHIQLMRGMYFDPGAPFAVFDNLSCASEVHSKQSICSQVHHWPPKGPHNTFAHTRPLHVTRHTPRTHICYN